LPCLFFWTHNVADPISPHFSSFNYPLSLRGELGRCQPDLYHRVITQVLIDFSLYLSLSLSLSSRWVEKKVTDAPARV
jgi:hypothetical protein